MNRSSQVNRKAAVTASIRLATVLVGVVLMAAGSLAAEQSGIAGSAGQSASVSNSSGADCEPVTRGSTYIPVDSWVYPAVMRLYALGYIDNVYLGMRPWTRASLSTMLDDTEDRLEDVDEGPVTSEAEGIYDALRRELRNDTEDSCVAKKGSFHIESVYSVMRGMSGTPLRDSYHLGSTIVNDYGRPYANGFNNYSGASGYASAGWFALYVRGEFQRAPTVAGYSPALVGELATLDVTNYFFSPTCFAAQQAQTSLPESSSTSMAARGCLSRPKRQQRRRSLLSPDFHDRCDFWPQACRSARSARAVRLDDSVFSVREAGMDAIETTQLAAIRRGAAVRGTILAGRLVHVFGTGHSRMAVEECSPATVVPGVPPIVELSMTYHNPVVGTNGQRQAMS